jgi:hypothetical protein
LYEGQVVEAAAGPNMVVAPRSESEGGVWQVVASNTLGADTSRAVRVEVRPFVGLEVSHSSEYGVLTPVERLVSGPALPAPDDLSARWALRWEDGGLHGRIEVTDAVLRNRDGRSGHNDGVEIYLDPDNAKTLEYRPDDVQLRITRGGSISAERGTIPEQFICVQWEVTGGYVVDFALPLGAAVSPGAFIGIDIHVIDNDNDRREHKIAWAAEDDDAYRSPASFGTVRLGR